MPWEYVISLGITCVNSICWNQPIWFQSTSKYFLTLFHTTVSTLSPHDTPSCLLLKCFSDFKQVQEMLTCFQCCFYPSGELISHNMFLQNSSVLSCLIILLCTQMLKTITTIFYYYHHKNNNLHSSHQTHMHLLPHLMNEKKFWGSEKNSYPSSSQNEKEIVPLGSCKCTVLQMHKVKTNEFYTFQWSSQTNILQIISKVNLRFLK